MSFTTIKIDENEVGLRFGYPCHRWFVESSMENKDYFDSKDNLNEIGVAKLLQFAYMNQCKVKEVNPSLEYEKFYLWVEERLEGQLRHELDHVLTIWAQSQPMKSAVQENEKKNQEDPKKTNEPTSTELKELPTENLG